MSEHHISGHELERYYLGMIFAEAELGALEEHLLGCPYCVARAKKSDYEVDLIRRALVLGNFDLGI